MTQDYLNSEIELTSKIFLYYTEKTLDYLRVNNDKYKKWYKDSLQLSFLLSLLKAVEIVDIDTNVIGYKEFTDNILAKTFYKVREYWLSDIDADYFPVTITDITVTDIQPPYYPFIPDWKEVYIDITEDNTTAITLPFVYANIDPQSIIISVVGAMDIVNIAPDNEEGCRIIGNIMYWNSGNYFHLDSGDRIFIKYLQITA